MLVQIDVYPDNGTESSETLYASPANVVNRRDADGGGGKDNQEDGRQGRLFTVGRKETDVLFPKAKAMSRTHATVRCVAAGGATAAASPDGFVEARNEEEAIACAASPYRMCLVLESLGKTGSFVASAEPVVAAPDKEEKDQGDDADETTDDEGISQPLSQAVNSGPGGAMLPPLSHATRAFFGTVPVKLTRLDAGESLILPLGATSDHPSSSVIIQFGIACDTVKITLVPFNVVLSGRVAATLKGSLHLCGGRAMDLPAAGRTTHCVTPKRMPVAKQLICWCLGIPIVTPAFLTAHLDRKALGDPLPDVNDYLAGQGGAMDSFWNVTPDPKLLSRYVLLSVDPDESERLAESAGTRVEALHAFGTEDDALKYAQTLMDRQATSAVVCFCVDPAGTSPSTAKSLHRKLTNQMGVPSIGLKDLAKAITTQSAKLKDGKGNAIDGCTNLGTATGAGDGGATESSRRTAVHLEVEDSATVPPEREDGHTFMTTSVATASRPLRDSDSGNDEKDSPRPSRNKIRDLNNLDTVREEAQEEGGEEKERTLPARVSKAAGINASTIAPGTGGSLLSGADGNGWFTVAPKDENSRKSMRREASSAYEKKNGASLELAAPTIGSVRIALPLSPSVLLHENQALNDSISSFYGHRSDAGRVEAKTSSSSGCAGLPNFKKFRKNVVPLPGSCRRIVLKEFVSEKAEKQRQINEQLQELEEQQRLADALFRGDANVGPRKRRRD